MRVLELDAKAVATLDRVLHEPARLSVVACLSIVDEADFVFLQSQTGMSGGNLSSHIKKLDGAGYIAIQKEFRDSKPRTSMKLTAKGRKAFKAYLGSMKAMLAVLDGNSG